MDKKQKTITPRYKSTYVNTRQPNESQIYAATIFPYNLQKFSKVCILKVYC